MREREMMGILVTVIVMMMVETILEMGTSSTDPFLCLIVGFISFHFVLFHRHFEWVIFLVLGEIICIDSTIILIKSAFIWTWLVC